jgi:hypothetical protein
MARQMYKIKQEIADGDRVALEVERVGKSAVPLDQLRAGSSLRKKGEVQGYCNKTHFYGTFPPLSRERYAISMGLCGQGSC